MRARQTAGLVAALALLAAPAAAQDGSIQNLKTRDEAEQAGKDIEAPEFQAHRARNALYAENANPQIVEKCDIDTETTTEGSGASQVTYVSEMSFDCPDEPVRGDGTDDAGSITAMCGAGEVLVGIQSGSAVCEPVSDLTDGFDPDQLEISGSPSNVDGPSLCDAIFRLRYEGVTISSGSSACRGPK